MADTDDTKTNEGGAEPSENKNNKGGGKKPPLATAAALNEAVEELGEKIDAAVAGGIKNAVASAKAAGPTFDVKNVAVGVGILGVIGVILVNLRAIFETITAVVDDYYTGVVGGAVEALRGVWNRRGQVLAAVIYLHAFVLVGLVLTSVLGGGWSQVHEVRDAMGVVSYEGKIYSLPVLARIIGVLTMLASAGAGIVLVAYAGLISLGASLIADAAQMPVGFLGTYILKLIGKNGAAQHIEGQGFRVLDTNAFRKNVKNLLLTVMVVELSIPFFVTVFASPAALFGVIIAYWVGLIAILSAEVVEWRKYDGWVLLLRLHILVGALTVAFCIFAVFLPTTATTILSTGNVDKALAAAWSNMAVRPFVEVLIGGFAPTYVDSITTAVKMLLGLAFFGTLALAVVNVAKGVFRYHPTPIGATNVKSTTEASTSDEKKIATVAVVPAWQTAVPDYSEKGTNWAGWAIAGALIVLALVAWTKFAGASSTNAHNTTPTGSATAAAPVNTPPVSNASTGTPQPANAQGSTPAITGGSETYDCAVILRNPYDVRRPICEARARHPFRGEQR